MGRICETKRETRCRRKGVRTEYGSVNGGYVVYVECMGRSFPSEGRQDLPKKGIIATAVATEEIGFNQPTLDLAAGLQPKCPQEGVSEGE